MESELAKSLVLQGTEQGVATGVFKERCCQRKVPDAHVLGEQVGQLLPVSIIYAHKTHVGLGAKLSPKHFCLQGQNLFGILPVCKHECLCPHTVLELCRREGQFCAVETSTGLRTSVRIAD